jgi:hypothetical protein
VGASAMLERNCDLFWLASASWRFLSWISSNKRTFSIAITAVLAEALEARLARGENVDISEYALLSSTLVRLANRIGIERVARDISPTLSDILRRSSP